MSIINFLDGEFVSGKAKRHGDLKVEFRGTRSPQLVTLTINHEISELVLLPEEAMQLVDSIKQAVECTGYLEEDG
jgi:hypothetical protein